MNPYAILIIGVAVVGVVYFGVGTVVRYRHGMRRCPDMLPNYTFWRAVVAHIRDGFMYAATCGKYHPPPRRDVAVLPSHVFSTVPNKPAGMEDDAFGELGEENEAVVA